MASNHKVYPEDTVQVFIAGNNHPIELDFLQLVDRLAAHGDEPAKAVPAKAAAAKKKGK